MLHIYICDDETNIGRQIQKDIERKICIEDYDMKVVCNTVHPRKLLETLQHAPQKRNIYFLDVELKDPEYDGFLLGKEIRKADPHGTLIFITGFENLAFRTFQYHLEAFDYIIKDADRQKDSIDRCLESLYLKLKDEQQTDIENIFSIKIGDTLKHIPIADILFFETSQKSHHVILHTAACRLDFVGNLNDIAKQMGDAFIRTHRAYLVALDKITEIDLKHHKAIVSGRECLISRNMKSQLLERLKRRNHKSYRK